MVYAFYFYLLYLIFNFQSLHTLLINVSTDQKDCVLSQYCRLFSLIKKFEKIIHLLNKKIGCYIIGQIVPYL